MFCYFDKNCDKSHILTHVGGGVISLFSSGLFTKTAKNLIFFLADVHAGVSARCNVAKKKFAVAVAYGLASGSCTIRL